LKLIRPLFLDELEERFVKARAKKRDLEKLLEHLGSLTFLDPAFMRKSAVSRDMAPAA